MNFEEFFNSYCDNNNNFFYKNNDTSNNFKNMDPDLYIILDSLVGNLSDKNLPFNIQYAVGNWLQLVGQAMVAYKTQVQYFQNGHGDYYVEKNKYTGDTGYCKEKKDKCSNHDKDILEIKEYIEAMSEEIISLKKQIEYLERNA